MEEAVTDDLDIDVKKEEASVSQQDQLDETTQQNGSSRSRCLLQQDHLLDYDEHDE